MTSLVPYDPSWPEAFARTAAHLHELSGGRWTIEHIGSTSIPGMIAKPVIDVAVKLDDDGFAPYANALMAEGWQDIGTGITTHDVLARLDQSGARTHIAHFFTERQWQTCPQRLFATWLREHPEDQAYYARAKQDALAAGLHGRAYTAAKTAAVHEIMNRACDTRGIPRIAAWDK